MKIVVLEDNRDRRGAMQKCLAERLYPFEAVFFESPQPMLCYLCEHLQEAICISLDHDMELVAEADGRLSDPGTGRQVADYLATRSPQCPVVIHTTNTQAGEGMKSVLEDAGWKVYRVAPWGDLEWVRAAWLRTVRDAIVGAARPKDWRRVAGTFGDSEFMKQVDTEGQAIRQAEREEARRAESSP